MIAPDRARAALLAGLEHRLQGYTPEWLPAERGPGRAFLQVLARYRHVLDRGLLRAPERGLLALLDMLAVRLAPASAARVPLVFTLAPDARLDVTLAAGSQVAAPPPPDAPSDPVVFATEQTVTLTRSRVAAVYSIEPGADRYADHSPAIARGFTLFADLVQTEHSLYLGHDTLFGFAGDITVIIGVSLARPAAAPLALRWEYLSDVGWIPLQSPKEDDTTGGLTMSGQLALRRACGPDAKKATFGGRTTFWLRATSRTPVIADASALPLMVNDLNARVRFRKTDLLPEAAFADFVKLDVTKDFFPFGLQPATFSSFYLASNEVFQRAGARVELTFERAVKGVPKSATLAWEYSSRDGWSRLEVDPFQGSAISPSTAAFVFANDGPGLVAFTCPPDWAETDVNGVSKRWMRVRITSGDFGKAAHFALGAAALTVDNLQPPVVRALRIGFEYLTDPVPLDHCLSVNDFVFLDHSEACLWPDQTFAPFRALADPAPAVHLAFDRPLPIGLVSLWVEVPESGSTFTSESPYVWEYRNAQGWTDLGVLDGTRGFRQSGMLQFIGPPDAVGVTGLGGDLYRLRARLKEGEGLAPSPVSGIWLNAVWGAHARRFERELLAVSGGTPGEALRFARVPVLEGEVVEVREWTGRGESWRTALDDVAETDLRFERDAATGVVTAVWVRWHERHHLHDSSPGERHYVIERATGVLRFGARPPGAGQRVVATYTTGGGGAGNVPAGSVRELRAAVPFVAGVTNPVAAQGGAGTETIEQVLRRGPQQLRHRGRALAAQDYEWLARDGSPEVARVRCQPLAGPNGTAERGWVTLLIAPRATEAQPAASPELARRIRAHVAQYAPATVALRIRTPEYMAVSVIASLVPEQPSEAAIVEARVRETLNRFLHPLAGGPNGHGWDFGQPVHLSQVAQAIEGTPGVDYTTSILLRCGDALCDSVVTVRPNALIAAGSHELTLRLGDR